MPEKKGNGGAEAGKELHLKKPEAAPDLDVAVVSKSEAEAVRTETEEPIDEKDRDALVARAEADIQRRGYRIDKSTGPFKSFGPRERFFIGKVTDSLGRECVAKISTSEEGPKIALEKEKGIIRAVDEAYRDAKNNGIVLDVEFPVLVDAWQEGATRGIATEFVADDKEKKRSLSLEDRFRILRKAIDGLQALNVTEALVDLGQDPLDGSAHVNRAESFLREIGDASISPAEQLRILEAFRMHAQLIDRLPMVASHGDLHGDNLAYTRDASGKETVTIMDLEMLRPTNAYYDLATTANLSSYARFFTTHKEAFSPIVKQLADSWLDEKSIGLDKLVESEIIAKDVLGTDAENAYRLMRIQHALEKMSGGLGDDPMAKLSREASLQIIREQLEEMLNSFTQNMSVRM